VLEDAAVHACSGSTIDKSVKSCDESVAQQGNDALHLGRFAG
jgi:hypothetical protein